MLGQLVEGGIGALGHGAAHAGREQAAGGGKQDGVRAGAFAPENKLTGAQFSLRPVQPVGQILLLQIAEAKAAAAALAMQPLIQQQNVAAGLRIEP